MKHILTDLQVRRSSVQGCPLAAREPHAADRRGWASTAASRPPRRRPLVKTYGFKVSESKKVTSPAGEEAEVDHMELVRQLFASKGGKVLVAQTAPAVRVSIGEEFGLPPGAVATGQLVAALRRLGFDYVFDVLVGADLTVVEEGCELMERLVAALEGRASTSAGGEGPGPLPLLTSCCPGWIAFVEHCAPELIPHVSTCKSPHMMMGALIKNHFSQKIGRGDADLVVVSIMPCVRKQGEADRIMHQTQHGARDVDHCLTTRDIAALIREAGIDFSSLPEEAYDDFLGLGSGAAALFGTTGGVMEAALRTVYDLATGERMPRLEYAAVRGLEGVKEATVTIAPHPEGPLHNAAPVTLRVAVANGLANAKKLVAAGGLGGACSLAEERAGQPGGQHRRYDFVEVMACPGGCVGGAGQPRSKDKDIVAKRQAALYRVDEAAVLRRSYESPVVRELYSEYLGEPLGPEAHRLLHTYYLEAGPPKFHLHAEAEGDVHGPTCHLPPKQERDPAHCEVDEPRTGEVSCCELECDICGAPMRMPPLDDTAGA